MFSVLKRRWLAEVFLSLLFLAVASVSQAQEKLKPFVLASESTADFQASIEQVRQALESAQFQVAGEYSPYPDAQVIIATSRDLQRLAANDRNAAFLVGQRIAVTKVGRGVQVSYTNPDYFALAYRIQGDIAPISKRLASALGRADTFGSKGLSASKLGKYHYTFGMEYFDDELTLAKYDDHAQALSKVTAAVNEKRGGVTPVYRIEIPEAEIAVIGVGLSEGMSSDQQIMQVVDHKPLKHTPHLPYEMVIAGGEVIALAPRFRIAIDFPDLRMTGEHGFTQLMASPDAIRKALTLAAGGEWEEKAFGGLQGR